MQQGTLPQLKKNGALHVIIEMETKDTQFGTLTFNVELKDGVAQFDTIKIVKNRRRKYSGI